MNQKNATVNCEYKKIDGMESKLVLDNEPNDMWKNIESYFDVVYSLQV